MSLVRYFIGAIFLPVENTDIYFEVKSILCFDFYAFGDVFRRSETVQQDRIVGNRFEFERTIPKNQNTLHHPSLKLRMAGRKVCYP